MRFIMIDNLKVRQNMKKYALILNGEYYSSFDTLQQAENAKTRIYNACEEEDDARAYYGAYPSIFIKVIEE